MLKKLLVVLACVTLIGCTAGHHVRQQWGDENQVVYKHSSHDTWLQIAREQAVEHCAKYDKKAYLLNNDCTELKYGPSRNCVSTFECR